MNKKKIVKPKNIFNKIFRLALCAAGVAVFLCAVYGCKHKTDGAVKEEKEISLPELKLISMTVHNIPVENNYVEVNADKIESEDIIALFSYGEILEEEIKININEGTVFIEEGIEKEIAFNVPAEKDRHGMWKGNLIVRKNTSLLPQIILFTNKPKDEYLGLSFKADGKVIIEGAKEDSPQTYKIEKNKITIKGKITKLDCSGNKLSSLDVTRASFLQELLCDDNELKEIAFGSGSKIRLLYCGNNKELKNLNLNRLALLDDFSCWGNGMTSINLSANPKLFSLICRDNKIEGELNLENNPLLEQINCYNNLITSIKLSGANKIRHMECLRNGIYGESMTSLLKSLPIFVPYTQDEWDDYLGMNPQGLYLIEPTELEKNIALKSDVTIAKEKGWKIFAIKIDDYGTVAPAPYDGK